MNVGEDRNDGFTVLDGAAMVVAAAFASLHMRVAVREVRGVGWALVWLTFAGVALTAGGSFVYLVRRFGRRPAGYPRRGDRLWALLGLPWIVASPFRPSSGGTPAFERYGMILTFGVTCACLFVLMVLWKSFVMAAPGTRNAETSALLWTERLGMALAVAWPLQCGFLLIVLDSESLPTIAGSP